MYDRLDMPSVLQAPPDIVRRLRAIRENAAVLHDGGRGMWMLGEIRPNEAKRKAARKTIERFYLNRAEAESTEAWQSREQQVFLRDAQLLYQGFAWIHDYYDPLDDFIVQDYQRRVWKEDVGLLDLEWREKMAESDNSNSLLRKVSLLRDKAATEGRDHFRRIMLKRTMQRPGKRVRGVRRGIITPDHRIVKP